MWYFWFLHTHTHALRKIKQMHSRKLSTHKLHRHSTSLRHTKTCRTNPNSDHYQRRRYSTVRRRPTVAINENISGAITETLIPQHKSFKIKYKELEQSNLVNYTDDHPVLGIRTRLANFAIKLLAVVLYIARACIDQGEPYSVECCACTGNITHFQEHGIEVPEYYKTEDERKDSFHKDPYNFDWSLILKVCRQKEMWYVQTALASFNFTYAWLMVILRGKGNMIRPIFTLSFGIEMITTVPFIVSIFHKPARNWWVPVFLNIWMANQALSNIIVSTSLKIYKSFLICHFRKI